MTRKVEERWDKMTSRQRGLHLVGLIDTNTRGVAKVASALAYLAETGMEVTGEAPALYHALHNLLATRKNLRGALEAELKVQKVGGNR